MNFADELLSLLSINVQSFRSEVYNNSQITKYVENAVLLYTDKPDFGGGGSVIPFKTILQEYLLSLMNIL
jgi:hypothetical protein